MADESQNDALQSAEQEAIAQLHAQLPYLYDADLAERVQAPTELDAALHRLDETVRLLTADTGITNDKATAALLLAYASSVARGEPDMRLLSLLGTKLIGPAEAQTTARAMDRLALAAVSWVRGNRPAVPPA